MLSAKQVRAIALLLELADVNSVAREVGVTPRAVQKWLQQEEFSGRLRRAVDLQFETIARENARGIARLAKISRDTIEQILKNPREVDAQTRLRAAIAVQDNLLALAERARNGSR